MVIAEMLEHGSNILNFLQADLVKVHLSNLRKTIEQPQISNEQGGSLF